MSIPNFEKMMTKAQAAKYLGCSQGTLTNWLWQKIGPRNYKYMGRLYFDPKDLEAYKKNMITRRAS